MLLAHPRPVLRRLARLWLLVVVCCAGTALFIPTHARAGTYDTIACWPSGAYQFSNHAFTLSNSNATFFGSATCDPDNLGLNTSAWGSGAFGQSSTLAHAAIPAGNIVSGWGATLNGSTLGNYQVAVHGFNGATPSPRWGYTCGSNCTFPTLAPNEASGLSFDSITFRTQCAVGGGCSGILGARWGGIWIRQTDNTPPVAASMSGTLFATTWVRGTKTVTWSASDASGIASSTLYTCTAPGGNLINCGMMGGTGLMQNANYTCDYSYVAPCPTSNTPTYSFDTTTVPDGSGYSMDGYLSDPASGLGAISRGYNVDNTVPTAPTLVRDGSSSDITYITTNAAMSLNWSGATDATAGIQDYDWCISTGTGCVGTVRSGTTASTSVTTGTTPTLGDGVYFSCVRTRDAAGNVSSSYACSNGFRVDTVAPTGPSSVDDGVPGLLLTSTGALTVGWTIPIESGSGMQGYEWCYNSTSNCVGASRSGSGASNGFTTSATPALAQGQNYLCARGIDNAGNVGGYTCSDGFTVDSVAPTAPTTVNDGTGADIDLVSSSTSFDINWSGATDATTGISNYDWCINDAASCTTPNRSGTTASTSVNSTSTALPLGTYWSCVRSRDNAAWTSGYACSDSFVLSPTLSISAGSSSVAMSPASFAPTTNATATTTLTVSTNNLNGYSVTATDEDDSWGADCACGAQVPDWTGTAATPTVWPSGTSGYWGFTVLSATGGRLAKWKDTTGGYGATDYVNNWYAGLKQNTTTEVHRRSTYGTGSDTIVTAYRANVGITQRAGAYDATIIYTITALP